MNPLKNQKYFTEKLPKLCIIRYQFEQNMLLFLQKGKENHFLMVRGVKMPDIAGGY